MSQKTASEKRTTDVCQQAIKKKKAIGDNRFTLVEGSVCQCKKN